MTALDVPNVSAIANWFGSSRMVADRIGAEIGRRPLVVVPFAGGMSELPYIDAAKVIVNDRHRHVINLARVIADPVMSLMLLERLSSRVFHPDELDRARSVCRRFERSNADDAVLFATDDNPPIGPTGRDAMIRWAESYFISTWMSRGGNGGKPEEFRGKLPVRYSPNGGGSAQRFWGAVGGVHLWHRIFGRCEFTTDDALDVIEQMHDSPKVAGYIDAPWPDDGDGYTHAFGDDQQRALATKLATFRKTRIVVRFGDHPRIRELYPEPTWTWVRYANRGQGNGKFDEVLILNGPSLAGRAS